MRTAEQRWRGGGGKHDKIHIISYFCALDHESVRISGNSNCCTILELLSNPAKALSSAEIPSVIRAVSPLLIISSHPAAEHPSPSTVTMSNADARVFQRSRRGKTVPSRRADLPPLSSPPDKNRLGSPPPARPCLSDRRGMEGTGQQIEERSASTPPPAPVRRRRI